MEQHNTSKNVTKRLKLFENEILFLVDNIGCNVSSHFDRIPSKDANYLPQIKLLFQIACNNKSEKVQSMQSIQQT